MGGETQAESARLTARIMGKRMPPLDPAIERTCRTSVSGKRANARAKLETIAIIGPCDCCSERPSQSPEKSIH
jgi:hypothetical protein